MTEPRVDVRQARTPGEWEALGVCCPRCHGVLHGDTPVRPAALTCAACARSYPVVCGIPDLRVGGDPYLTASEDRRAAERLDALATELDFAALYAAYYEGNDKVSAEQVVQFTRGVLAASARAGATVAAWEELGVPLARGTGMVIDLGCGTAPLGVALAARGHAVVAIDAGMRWLVMARRRAAEAGIDLPVICANAEHLPLRDGVAARVAGESVLENLADPAGAMKDAFRVLSSGGALWLTTANRRSIGPDPHLGVLAGGWWPQRWLERHAARTGKVMPRRTLFTAGTLTRLLRSAGFATPRLALPVFAREQRAGLPPAVNAAIGVYHVVRRTPVVRALVLRIAPAFVVSAHRP